MPKQLRLFLFLLLYFIFAATIIVLGIGAGVFWPFWVLPALMGGMALLKGLAGGRLLWLVWAPQPAPPLPVEDTEFVIQSLAGRPITFNVVPDQLPHLPRSQQLFLSLLLLGALILFLQPENFVLAPTYQLWVSETGTPHFAHITDLRPVTDQRRGFRCYLTYLYELPTGQVIAHEQEISQAWYAQLLAQSTLSVPIRYAALDPTTSVALDPEGWRLLAYQFALPFFANVGLSGLALAGLWVWGPPVWQSRRRTMPI